MGVYFIGFFFAMAHLVRFSIFYTYAYIVLHDIK
jgi:hypothetical protein